VEPGNQTANTYHACVDLTEEVDAQLIRGNYGVLISVVQAIVDSVLMCRSREKTFKIIDAVSGTIRSSRYTRMTMQY
jgi:hypothetical protein